MTNIITSFTIEELQLLTARPFLEEPTTRENHHEHAAMLYTHWVLCGDMSNGESSHPCVVNKCKVYTTSLGGVAFYNHNKTEAILKVEADGIGADGQHFYNTRYTRENWLAKLHGPSCALHEEDEDGV